jgi:hypothetical protein
MSRDAGGCSFRSSDFAGQPEMWERKISRPRPAVPLAPPPPVQPPAAPPGAAPALARAVPPLRSGPDDDGKRDCMRGGWCLGYGLVTEDGKTRRRPGRGYQAFCPKDRRLLETDLSQMPAQFVHLAAEIGNPVRNGQMIRMPFGPRILIRIDIDTLMRAVVESMASWHERIADADSLTYPSMRLSRLQRQMVAVRNAERILVHRVDALLALDRQPMSRTRSVVSGRDPKGRSTEDVVENEDLDGADAGMEIFTLRYLCRAVLGETKAKPEVLLGVPCRREECDKLTLRRAELPSDPKAPVWWSECSECGDRLSEEEYREWTRRYARWAEGKTVPALENLPGVA